MGRKGTRRARGYYWIVTAGGAIETAKKHRSYRFTLIFEGVSPLTTERLDALFEAGRDDAAFGQFGALHFADFDREASTFVREVGRHRLIAEALIVQRAYWRQGVGTRLMQQAEEWGRERGAEVALLDSYVDSPVSVPFYERRMGYRRRALRFAKPLTQGPAHPDPAREVRHGFGHVIPGRLRAISWYNRRGAFRNLRVASCEMPRRGRMRENPFRYGEIVSGAFFTDRQGEIDEVLGDVRSGQNLVVISPRRYGKTSLLFAVAARARQEGALTAYVDLLRTPSKERFADHLAGAIYGGLVAPLERVLQRAVTIFQRLPLQPKVTINPDGTPSFEFSPGTHERDIDRTIERLLTLPGEIARERKRRVVLVLDEFQEVIALDEHLPALMRSVFQEQAEVAHVFAGSRRHLMQRVFTDVNQPMYRLAKPMALRGIRPADFAPFIQERFAVTGQEILPAAIARVLDLTDGHPHDTQQLCYFLWAEATAREMAATAALVEVALDRVLDAEEAHYVTLWEGLTPHRRLVLSTLAREPGRVVYSEEYRRRHGLGSSSSMHRTLTYLTERELIEFAPDETYFVPDVFLRAWITRRLAPPGRASP